MYQKGDELEKERQATPESLPGKPHGQRNLAGYSPKGLTRLSNQASTHKGMKSKGWVVSFQCATIRFSRGKFKQQGLKILKHPFELSCSITIDSFGLMLKNSPSMGWLVMEPGTGKNFTLLGPCPTHFPQSLRLAMNISRLSLEFLLSFLWLIFDTAALISSLQQLTLLEE